jgi:15,16-dihydrobiliverdin:ferredoxin oxidoreductase
MMSVKDILFSNFKNLVAVDLPDWLDSEIKDNNSIIKSYIWKTDNLRRIRLCELNINQKFIAESLVIYPNFDFINPIFGTEFVICGGKKFFGTIDFHPLKTDSEYEDKYINKYLGDQPNRAKDKSKIYDLDLFFSKKLWIKTSSENFYKEYLDKLNLYLFKYNECTKKCEQEDAHIYQKNYDHHLSFTDPAYGILKAHYTKDFAEKYIKDFLFNLA